MNKGSKWERVFPKALTQSGHIFSSDSSGDSNLWRVDTKTNCNGGGGRGAGYPPPSYKIPCYCCVIEASGLHGTCIWKGLGDLRVVHATVAVPATIFSRELCPQTVSQNKASFLQLLLIGVLLIMRNWYVCIPRGLHVTFDNGCGLN